MDTKLHTHINQASKNLSIPSISFSQSLEAEQDCDLLLPMVVRYKKRNAHRKAEQPVKQLVSVLCFVFFFPGWL